MIFGCWEKSTAAWQILPAPTQQPPALMALSMSMVRAPLAHHLSTVTYRNCAVGAKFGLTYLRGHGLDLLKVLSGYDKEHTEKHDGDIDHNGAVDIDDLLYILK